jgi:hypothetical protein
MRFTITLAVILAMVFAIGASCQSQNAEQTVEAPFHGGIDGITAEFMELGTVSDTGPENEVWEDEDFPLEVRLQNRGEYTLGAHEVELELKGISPNDFQGVNFQETNPNEIEKVSEWLPEGGEDYVDFGDAHYMNLIGTHYDANIFVYFTYPYETYINIPKVCYKDDIKDRTICDVDTTKQAFASGGPFQVGSVQERYIGKGKILLEVPIRNVAKGRAKAYSNDEFQTNFDEVEFVIDDPDWECQSRGNPSVARISHPSGQPGNEDVFIRCINENLEEGALYTRSVTITLRYYYQDWLEQRVRIRENPE